MQKPELRHVAVVFTWTSLASPDRDLSRGYVNFDPPSLCLSLRQTIAGHAKGRLFNALKFKWTTHLHAHTHSHMRATHSATGFNFALQFLAYATPHRRLAITPAPCMWHNLYFPVTRPSSRAVQCALSCYLAFFNLLDSGINGKLATVGKKSTYHVIGP